jgi:hypothetical protein
VTLQRFVKGEKALSGLIITSKEHTNKLQNLLVSNLAYKTIYYGKKNVYKPVEQTTKFRKLKASDHPQFYHPKQ